MATEELVLYDGKIDTQRLRVWLEWGASGSVMLLTHELGPKLEQFFGDDEIETFLEIDREHLPVVAAALGGAGADPMALLAERFRDDSMATTHLRELLAEHDIPYRFNLV